MGLLPYSKGGIFRMKQKLMMLFAVLLTGGMLVACGPGDGTGADEVGGGGGVVDEPLEGTEGGALDGGALDGGDTALNGDVATGDDAALEEPAAEEGVGAEGDVAAEGEEIQLDVEEDAEVPVESADQAAQDEPAAGAEEPAAEQPAEEQPAEGEEVAGGGAAPAQGEPVTITFTQAAEGVAVENIQGAEDAQSIAETGQPNPDLTLTTGQRYEFSYDGEGDLVFYNANDEELLSTAGTDSQFAQDSEVQAETGDGQLSFTLTEQLAQEIDRYAVGPDQQGGQVNVN